MKKKVTLPRVYHPGKGHPPETLAYLSPAEHDLIRRLTDGTAQRGPKGVRSYADDSSSSKGVSRGDTSGTKGSGGLGQGGQAGGSASGSKASGSPSGGVSTGGANRGGNSGVSGSKGGGASTQAPGMGGNAGPIGSRSLSNAASGLASSRQTALGGISQAAQSNIGRSPAGSATAAEHLASTNFFNSQLGSLRRDPAINPALPAALQNGMWNQRISDATRVAKGQAPVGAFGERSLAPWDDAGFRTKAQAAANAAAGTGIKASFHNYGLAADIVTPGFPGSYTSPAGRAWQNASAAANRDLANKIDPGLGVQWGGAWSKADPSHFQLGSGSRAAALGQFGTTVAQEGVRPGGQVASTASFGNGPAVPGIGSGTQFASASPFGSVPAAPRAPAGPNIVAAASTPATTTDSAPSFWQQAGNFVKAKTDEVQKKITENKPMLDWAGRHPTLAKIGISIMNAPGGKMPGNLGTAQDRSYRVTPPPPMQQPQTASNYGADAANVSTNPMTVLTNLKANMIAKGASPEQIAYVQSIIDELSQTQVA